MTSTLVKDPITTDQQGKTLSSVLSGWVQTILEYLKGNSTTAPAGLPVELSVNRSDVASLPTNTVKVEVCFRIDRNKVDPEIAQKAPRVAAVEDPLLPPIVESKSAEGSNGTTSNLGIRVFARQFESAFLGFDGGKGQLKVAVGPKVSDAQGGFGNRALWAVRWGPGEGVSVSFPNAVQSVSTNYQPAYFAPTPLSTQLISRQVKVREYKSRWTGSPSDITDNEFEMTFSRIDMDAWARQFLSAVNALLAPEMATAIAELDSTGYNSYMSFKEQLAEGISNHVANVFSRPDNPGNLKTAQERFRQSLLTALTNDYGTSAIVQVPAEVSVKGGANGKGNSDYAPKLFGKISAGDSTVAAAGPKSPYAISTARLPIVEGGQLLTFLVSTQHPEAQAELDLNLNYDIGFLEHDLDADEEKCGYVPSSWLTFVLPQTDPDKATPVLTPPIGDVEIPIPLRSFPPAPVLQNQQAISPDPNTTTQLEEALQWTYRAEFGKPPAKQDSLTVQVTFNETVSAATFEAAAVAGSCAASQR